MSTRPAPAGTSARYALYPLGCKVSQAEAAEFARVLDASGWVRTGPGEPPAVVVVHGCAITRRAERDARRLVRRLLRERPGSRVVVAGCLGESALRQRSAVPGASQLLPLAASRGALDVSALLAPCGAEPAVGAPAGPPAASCLAPGRTRAFLKVQDGCGRRCAFCVVPSLRGPERSLPLRTAADAVHRLGDQGVPEVVLVGIHLAAWGRDRGERLLDLLEELERHRPACRVRLSSLEPMGAGEALVDHVAGSQVVVPHLHLPLQSGSDAVLLRMRRGLLAGRFERLVRRAVRANPRLHVATDLIAGYPGETDAEFEQTEALAAALPLASVHVFPFSPRPGTDAAREHAERPVPPDVVARRAASLRALGESKHAAFVQAAAGSRADVVVLRGGRGLTDNYLSVRVAPEAGPPGSRGVLRLALAGGELVGSAPW